jgi:hypothetical protein
MTCQTAAHDYLARGLTPIPIGAGKVPNVKWTEFQNRRPSDAEVDKWFADIPESRVGIITGRLSGVTVIDIDNSDGLSEFRRLCGDAVAPTVLTPRGGRHIYCRYTPVLVNKSAVLKGIDIRNDGGLVVAPPSAGYKWLEGRDQSTPLPTIPPAFIKAATVTLGAKKGVSTAHPGAGILEEGTRNDSLFHILYKMAKGGETREGLEAHALAVGRATGLGDKEIKITMESALNRVAKKDSSITAEIEEWVKACTGPFKIGELRKEMNMDFVREDKILISSILHRLKERLIIEPTGKVQGEYRTVVRDMEEIDWRTAPTDPMEIAWPLGIGEFVNVYPHNIIIIAGHKDAGKTATLLDITARNMSNFDIHYFTNEMGGSEARVRIGKRKDLSPNQWDFHLWSRADHYEDVIQPNGFNIIDYLEVADSEEYKIKTYIARIWNKLDKGIAIIALQKPANRDVARGGDGTMDRARVYLALNPGVVKMVSVKDWKGDKNPNGMQRRFRLVDGWEFIPDGGWQSKDDITAEDFAPVYKPKRGLNLQMRSK